MKWNLLSIIFWICFFFTAISAEWKESPDAKKVKHIVLDAGHGGKDPGCLGKTSKEKSVALKIAQGVEKKFEENTEVTVSLTRSKDVFIGLKERAMFANKKKADLFISIHCNANKNKSAAGSETYAMGTHKSDENLEVMKRENGVIKYEEDFEDKYEGFDNTSEESLIFFQLHQTAHLKQSLKLASKIEKQFVEQTQRKSRGVKQAGYLVLWKTTMPSVLIEVGFLTNKSDEKFLNSAEGQRYVINSIYRGILKYQEGK